jgi:hypothetical protein
MFRPKRENENDNADNWIIWVFVVSAEIVKVKNYVCGYI